MAWQTPKTDWKAGDVPSSNDFNRIEENIRIIGRYDRAPAYAITKGSANVYNVELIPAPEGYYEGMCIAVKINVDNTGASTLNVNGLGAKPIKRPNGQDVAAGNLRAGVIYTLRYNGQNFILQGSDSAGNATPADVLAGKTFSNDNGPDQVGTMPNHGAIVITPGTVDQTIPQGYHNGQGYVRGSTNLIPANIKKGIDIFGVIGTLQPALVYKEDKSVTVGYGNNIYTFNVGFEPNVVGFEIQTNTGEAYISQKAAVIVGYKIYSLNNTLMTGRGQDDYVKVIEPLTQDNAGTIVYPDGVGSLYFEDVIISGNTVTVTLYASYAVTNPTVLSLVAVNFTS